MIVVEGAALVFVATVAVNEDVAAEGVLILWAVRLARIALRLRVGVPLFLDRGDAT